ncbi:50S ribosomal protein L18 [Acetivibrio mesophilus]|uniref:Large ribosomal subunit protein uL18 n=1 Tax=Acetivibrio mesophilus TaxID=2487273 RepID=A0A4Q0I3H0_9FIRM|nr:50S ribosomal protein L18 [Acetivibrio mesophilus]ODM26732.1 50S ribosomal protein L18 [Clostridium sp. Bc-iso-3]RXE58245.1 50S ribosomal protein L18 [Acetivibrio mesophilus]HHV28242.1 50S ribosomal protein L18 [Clostridium sp.]
MIKKPGSNVARVRKHARVRKKVVGTAERPRLNVYRSLTNIYAQVIDDTAGKTLVSASSLDKDIKSKLGYCGNKEAAREVGKLVAKKALASGIKSVVFDRGGYIYHGRIQELAEGAREAGLEF